MQVSTYVWIGIGGFFGAVLRYGINTWLTTRWGAAFPYGTLFVNVSGSFVLGLIIAMLSGDFDVAPDLRLALTVGFLGSYTTFSTFSVDALVLFENGHTLRGLSYVVGSVAGSGLMGAAGLLLGRSL
jgi:CrcB protein